MFWVLKYFGSDTNFKFNMLKTWDGKEFGSVVINVAATPRRWLTVDSGEEDQTMLG